MGAKTVRLAGICLAALAVCAQAATAAEFRAGKWGQATGPFVTHGGSGTAGHQQLTLGPLHVACGAARSTGSIESDRSRFFLDTIKLTRCEAQLPLGEGTVGVPARVSQPLQLGLDAFGESAALLSDVTVQIKSVKCTISIPQQTLLAVKGSPTEGAGAGGPPLFTPTLVPTLNLRKFPSGEQQKLAIAFDQHGRLTFGGACASLQPSDFVYSGELVEEVRSGELSWDSGASIQDEEEEASGERVSPPWE